MQRNKAAIGRYQKQGFRAVTHIVQLYSRQRTTMHANGEVGTGAPQHRPVLAERPPDYITRTLEIVGAQDLEVR